MTTQLHMKKTHTISEHWSINYCLTLFFETDVLLVALISFYHNQRIYLILGWSMTLITLLQLFLLQPIVHHNVYLL